MSELNERISLVIEKSGLSKTTFAEKIHVSQQHVSRISSNGNPSDRTIIDICKKFNVSEAWLRTGTGEMFHQLSRHEEVAKFFGGILKCDDEDFKLKFISSMARLEESDWLVVEKIIDGLSE